MAKYWPEFESKESGLFKKNKLIPKLPTSIDDLADLPEELKLKTTNRKFLASPQSLFSELLVFISLTGLNILAKEKTTAT